MNKIVLLGILSLGLAAFKLDGYHHHISDNSAFDPKGKNLSAQDQSENEADIQVTRKIREAIVGDSALSTGAKNIKIITINGNVTLDGIVRNQQEKDRLEGIAKHILGVKAVINKLNLDRENNRGYGSSYRSSDTQNKDDGDDDDNYDNDDNDDDDDDNSSVNHGKNNVNNP